MWLILPFHHLREFIVTLRVGGEPNSRAEITTWPGAQGWDRPPLAMHLTATEMSKEAVEQPETGWLPWTIKGRWHSVKGWLTRVLRDPVVLREPQRPLIRRGRAWVDITGRLQTLSSTCLFQQLQAPTCGKVSVSAGHNPAWKRLWQHGEPEHTGASTLGLCVERAVCRSRERAEGTTRDEGH